MASSIKISILELDGVEYDVPVEIDLIQALESTGWIKRPLSSNSTNSSNNAWVQPASLTADLVAGSTYNITWRGIFSTPATTTGLGLSLQGTATFTNFAATAKIPTGATAFLQAVITALNAAITSTGVGAANTKYFFKVDGTFLCSASGTLGLAFRSEVNNSTVTLYAGSNIEVKEVV